MTGHIIASDRNLRSAICSLNFSWPILSRWGGVFSRFECIDNLNKLDMIARDFMWIIGVDKNYASSSKILAVFEISRLRLKI